MATSNDLLEREEIIQVIFRISTIAKGCDIKTAHPKSEDAQKYFKGFIDGLTYCYSVLTLHPGIAPVIEKVWAETINNQEVKRDAD